MKVFRWLHAGKIRRNIQVLNHRPDLDNLIGKPFRTLTDLRPSGYIIAYEGKVVDAFAQDGHYIHKGAWVQVVRTYFSWG